MATTKYSVDLESFFDLHLFYPASEKLLPLFRSWSFTPNILTTFSLITMALATYFLFVDTRVSAFLLVASYLFDCCDGMFARKYNMCSPFGMAYDATKDGIMNSTFYFLLIYRYTSYFHIDVMITLLFSFITVYLCTVWLGINEAIVHFNTHGDTNYAEHRVKQFKQKTIGVWLYVTMMRIFYILVKPYVRNNKKMHYFAGMLKVFGLGNLNAALFFLLYFIKLP